MPLTRLNFYLSVTRCLQVYPVLSPDGSIGSALAVVGFQSLEELDDVFATVKAERFAAVKTALIYNENQTASMCSARFVRSKDKTTMLEVAKQDKQYYFGLVVSRKQVTK